MNVADRSEYFDEWKSSLSNRHITTFWQNFKYVNFTLIGETFASPKTREFFWINFRDLTNRRNFANEEIENILRDKLSRIAIFSFENF